MQEPIVRDPVRGPEAYADGFDALPAIQAAQVPTSAPSDAKSGMYRAPGILGSLASGST